MKIVNSYNEEGYFDGEIPCQESPLEKGKYLIPARSTEIPLPALLPTQEAKFINGVWEIVESRAEIYRKKREKEIADKEQRDKDDAKLKQDRIEIKSKVKDVLGLSNKEMDILFGVD